MDFQLSKELRLLKQNIRRFAEEEIKPLAKIVDETDQFPLDIYKKMAKLGYIAPRIPAKYGGSELSVLETVIAGEEITRASGSIGLATGVQNLVTLPILYFGNEDQKKIYLEGVATGKLIGAFALTEPCCGSDAAAIKTRAYEDRDGFKISGSKMFITAGTVADFYVVFARLGEGRRAKGVAAFIVDKKGNEKSIEVNKLSVMGFRGTGTAEIFFNECWIPKENLLARPGDGFRAAMLALDEARIYASAAALGLAQAAYDEAFEYAKEREAFEKKIIDFQGIQWMLTDMATELEAMRLLTYKAAWLKDQGDPEYVKLASMAKLYSAIKAVDIARMAVQILGGYGYSKDSNVERIYRDVKLLEIGEGTNEIQRIILIRALLGKLVI